MDTDRSDRVIDLQFRVDENHSEVDKYTSDQTDEDRIKPRHQVGSRGDPDKSRENSVESHAEIRLAAVSPGSHRRREATSGRSHRGCDEDQ